MNRPLLFLILLSFYSFSYSQKRDIPATLITQNNDTLKINMVVGVNLHDKKEIEETSITKRITYRNNENKKKKIEAKDVKKVVFTDLQGKERLFAYDGKRQLQQVIYEGITKAYYVYYVDLRYGIVRSFVDIYNKDGKRVKPGTFGTDHTILKRAVDEIPELVAIVDDQSLTFEEKIVLVLSKYDNDYLKK